MLADIPAREYRLRLLDLEAAPIGGGYGALAGDTPRSQGRRLSAETTMQGEGGSLWTPVGFALPPPFTQGQRPLRWPFFFRDSAGVEGVLGVPGRFLQLRHELPTLSIDDSIVCR